ncbi:MAG: hypothetical protein ACOYOJ_14380 [Alsobacter sp.]
MTISERRAEWIFRAVIIGLALLSVLVPVAPQPGTHTVSATHAASASMVVTEVLR